jgi:hypothetical protein
MPASSVDESHDGCRLVPLTLGGNKLPWWLSLEIRLVAGVIPILNRFLSPQRLARLLEPRWQSPPPREQYPRDLACHIGRLLQRQAFKRQSHCILRSYLLYRFLRRYGYPAVLNFGLMGDHREEGHCWITLNGEVFFDETDPDKEFATQVAASENVVYWI